jgi:hypothetical protein
MVHVTVRQLDSLTVGHLDSWTVWQLESLTVGQLDSWTAWQLDSSTVFCFELALILLHRLNGQVTEAVLVIALWVLKVPKCWANGIMTRSLRRSHKNCLKPRNVCWMRASLQHLYVLKLNVGQQLCVVKLKREVVIPFCPFIVLPYPCQQTAPMWSRMAVGGDKLQLSHKIPYLLM